MQTRQEAREQESDVQPGAKPAVEPLEMDLSSDDQLPTLGGQMSNLLEVVSDEDVEYRDLVDAIEQCPSIAARLMFLANSAWAAPAVPITSLEGACGHLGLRLVRSVSIGLAVASPFDPTRCPAFDAARFWSSALSVADGCVWLSEIARDSQGLERQTLYTAGLLHSLGLLWLAEKHPDAVAKIALGVGTQYFENLSAVAQLDTLDATG